MNWILLVVHGVVSAAFVFGLFSAFKAGRAYSTDSISDLLSHYMPRTDEVRILFELERARDRRDAGERMR